jgi:hypothetical protein
VFVLASLEYAYPSVPPDGQVCAVDKPRASLRVGTVRRPYRGCDSLSQLSHLTRCGPRPNDIEGSATDRIGNEGARKHEFEDRVRVAPVTVPTEGYPMDLLRRLYLLDVSFPEPLPEIHTRDDGYVRQGENGDEDEVQRE